MTYHDPGMKESAIVYPSDTIILAEKDTTNYDYYMDFNEPSGPVVGNDVVGILEESRHDSRGEDTDSGGSNYAFADGSARFLRVHTSVYPLNLFAITASTRTSYAILPAF
jgi:prepilin-type processing-associated H-X9-DG protein